MPIQYLRLSLQRSWSLIKNGEQVSDPVCKFAQGIVNAGQLLRRPLCPRDGGYVGGCRRGAGSRDKGLFVTPRLSSSDIRVPQNQQLLTQRLDSVIHAHFAEQSEPWAASLC